MTVDKSVTPLPVQELTPIQVEVADWFDLPANDEHEPLEVNNFADQTIEINHVGGRPETDVDINLVGEEIAPRTEERRTQRETIETEPLVEFGDVAGGGPIATERLAWRADNGSSTDFTQASANEPYQTHLNYTIRQLTVAEKLLRGMNLRTDEERELAERFNLMNRNNFGLPKNLDDVVKTNFEDKTVIKNELSFQRFDINNSGETAGITVVNENNLQNRGIVAYITSIGINSQTHDLGGGSIYNDDVIIDIETSGFNFFKLSTAGLPGIKANSYEADVFIPATDSMSVNVYSPNNAPNNMDVRIEYKLVRRTLLEKAIHNLRSEINTGSDEGRIFNEIRDRIKAGVDVSRFVEDELTIQSE